MLSLRQVTVGIDRHGHTLAKVMESVATLRWAVDFHPHRPIITFDIRPLIQQDEAQRANGMNKEFIIDMELIGEQRKLPEKFLKFHAETSSYSTSRI